MSKKNGILVATVLVLVAAAGFMVWSRSAAPLSPQAVSTQSLVDIKELPPLESSKSSVPEQEVLQVPAEKEQQKPSSESKPAQGVFTGEEEVMGGDLQVFEITYNGKQYTPKSLSVKSGDVVIFKNASTVPFWPASGSHPAHTAYPEFDPKKPVPAGGTFEFKFIRTGTWSFHDHLNPSTGGSVVVE